MIYMVHAPFIRLVLQTEAEQMKAQQFQKDTMKGAVLREFGWCFEFEIPREEGLLRLCLRAIVGSNHKADTYWSKLVFQVKREIN